MNDYKLVPATQADKEYLLTLRLTTMGPHFEKAGLNLSEDEHRELVDENFQHCYLLLRRQQCVGMLKYQDFSEHVYIFQIQISADFQNQGIGGGVIRDFIQSNQGKPIKLSVLKENPAKQLYLSLGFKIIGQDDHEYFMRFD